MRSSNKVIVVVGCALLVAGCMPPKGSRPFAGKLPAETYLDLTGTFTFSPEGTLRLALAKPCMVQQGILQVDCKEPELERIAVEATTPWEHHIRGVWRDARHLEFQADWKASKLDPLADDAAAVVGRAWSISGTAWQPTAAEVQTMLTLIGNAIGIETDVQRGGQAPKLEIATFEIAGDTLRIGETTTLTARIANRGAGPAYRVVARTRSSIATLHNRQLSFGTIAPGTEKVRTIKLELPGSETATDTMLVLAVSEGNGFAPGNASRRVAIAPSRAAPTLVVACSDGRNAGGRLALDAGQQLALRCTVENTGDAAASEVVLEVSVAGGPAVRSAPQAIAPAGRVAFNVPIIVPRGLPIDSVVEIAITARDRKSSRVATTTVPAGIRKAKLCVVGQLTLAQYQAKVGELKAAVDAKYLTKAEFDRYDAELVACLQ